MKSIHGMTSAQVYVTMEGLVKVYHIKNKGEAFGALNNFCTTVGLSLTIVTDTSKTVCGEMSKKYLLQQPTTAPDSPWQNKES